MVLAKVSQGKDLPVPDHTKHLKRRDYLAPGIETWVLFQAWNRKHSVPGDLCLFSSGALDLGIPGPWESNLSIVLLNRVRIS